MMLPMPSPPPADRKAAAASGHAAIAAAILDVDRFGANHPSAWHFSIAHFRQLLPEQISMSIHERSRTCPNPAGT